MSALYFDCNMVTKAASVALLGTTEHVIIEEALLHPVLLFSFEQKVASINEIECQWGWLDINQSGRL